jgi:hypothetical protein
MRPFMSPRSQYPRPNALIVLGEPSLPQVRMAVVEPLKLEVERCVYYAVRSFRLEVLLSAPFPHHFLSWFLSLLAVFLPTSCNESLPLLVQVRMACLWRITLRR